MEDKLKWAFKLYDKDQSGKLPAFVSCYFVSIIAGFIDMQELLEIVTTFYGMEVVLSETDQPQLHYNTDHGVQGVPRDSAKTKAESIFRALDTNCDGQLDEVEFCQGCLNDQEFSEMIQAGVNKLKTEQDFAMKMKK